MKFALSAVCILVFGGLCLSSASAQHEHDLRFGYMNTTVPPASPVYRMQVNAPATYEVPRILNYDGFIWIGDLGIDGFRLSPANPWQIKTFTWQQISYTSGLTIGSIFGNGKPGFINLDSGPNRHIHFPVIAGAPGTYMLQSHLINGVANEDSLATPPVPDNTPLVDSEPFTIIWVTGSTVNPDDPAWASVDLPLLRNLPDTPPNPTDDGFAGVDISNLVVSAVFAGGFYAQTEGRTGGVRVLSPESVSVGQRVQVKGNLSTYGAEKIVSADYVYKTAGDAPAPLVVTARYIGGGKMGKYTPGTKNGVGLSTTGLLVKTGGRLRLESGNYYLDDGSVVPNDAASVKGVKISFDISGTLSLPAAGTPVVVTGISGSFVSGGDILPVIKPRSQSDISF